MPPPEYTIMRASRWLGVAPWDLVEHPAWLLWAIEYMGAEARGEQQRHSAHGTGGA